VQTGKVYKRGNWWMLRYKVPTWVDGRKVWTDEYKKLAPADKYESEAALRRDNLVPAVPDGASATPQRTQLLSDFVERVYFPKAETKLKASTLRSYRQVYNCYVKPRTNGHRMCDFSLPTAQKFLDGIAAEKSLSVSSFQKIKWFAVAVFDTAQIEGAFDSNFQNPFFKVELPRNRRPKQATRYATLEHVLAMIEVLNHSDERDEQKRAMMSTAARVIAVAAFSGLRKSEIQGLKWGDIKNGQISVRRTAWRPTMIEEGGKTEASQSTVPIIKALAEHLKKQRNGLPAEGFVFAGPKLEGNPLDLKNLAARTICPTLKKAEIPWCGWHGFRRSLATNLHELGVNDLTVRAILRHSDVGVTQQAYIKSTDKVKAEGMAKLQTALAAAKKKARQSK
jgi:integrase